MRAPTRPLERGCRRRTTSAILVIALALCMGLRQGQAASPNSGLANTLSQAPDFRVRVSAALALGRSRDRSTATALIAALQDSHPAVRTAAAAGLGALGCRTAAGPLRSQAAREQPGAARSEMLVVASGLERRSDTRLLVQIGPIHNATSPRADRHLERLRGSARLRASELEGIEVLSDAVDAADESARRKLPVLAMDGALQRLSQSRAGTKVAVTARVEFAVRRLPDQAIKATLGGNAELSGEQDLLRNDAKLADLEAEVLDAATESALRVAPSAMVSLGR